MVDQPTTEGRFVSAAAPYAYTVPEEAVQTLSGYPEQYYLRGDRLCMNLERNAPTTRDEHRSIVSICNADGQILYQADPGEYALYQRTF